MSSECFDRVTRVGSRQPERARESEKFSLLSAHICTFFFTVVSVVAPANKANGEICIKTHFISFNWSSSTPFSSHSRPPSPRCSTHAARASQARGDKCFWIPSNNGRKSDRTMLRRNRNWFANGLTKTVDRWLNDDNKLSFSFFSSLFRSFAPRLSAAQRERDSAVALFMVTALMAPLTASMFPSFSLRLPVFVCRFASSPKRACDALGSEKMLIVIGSLESRADERRRGTPKWRLSRRRLAHLHLSTFRFTSSGFISHCREPAAAARRRGVVSASETERTARPVVGARRASASSKHSWAWADRGATAALATRVCARSNTSTTADRRDPTHALARSSPFDCARRRRQRRRTARAPQTKRNAEKRASESYITNHHRRNKQ